jgi:hypothetical protein
MTPSPGVAHSLFSQRLTKIYEDSNNDIERSTKILECYLADILRPASPDPAAFSYQVCDGPDDGGLDAYAVDDEEKEIWLIQGKWYGDERKLSEKESVELINFVQHRLLLDDRSDLNSDVKAFMSKYQAYYVNYKAHLVYVTNAEFDKNAAALYKQLKAFSFNVLGEEDLATEWYNVLSKNEPVDNNLLIALREGCYFTTGFTVPGDEGKTQGIRVLQCMLSALDLRRAYDRWMRKLLIRNLRYGIGGNINLKMKATAESDLRTAFYAFHNGISIVCPKFEIIEISKKPETEDLKKMYPFLDEGQIDYITSSPDTGAVKQFVFLKDFQVVNGGQSTVTLSEVKKEMLKDIFLPCKITETSSEKLSDTIAIYNNTQNKITPEDLVSNSPEQTFLQNYAALEIDPPIFYQRKRGEKWVDIFRARSGEPPKERRITYPKAFQAFLAFMGDPGDAYSRPAAFVSPDGMAYRQINDYSKKDVILMSGIISNYEGVYSKADPEPAFVKYWTQWAVASFGHISRYGLNSTSSNQLKDRMLSETGMDEWKRIRGLLIVIVKRILKAYFQEIDEQGYQKLFKNDAEVFDLSKIKIRSSEISKYLDSRVKGEDLLSVANAQDELDYKMTRYEVHFAVFARMIDKVLDDDPSLLSKFIPAEGKKTSGAKK